MGIPRQLLRELYTFGSLQNTHDGVAFRLKNRLLATSLTSVTGVRINDREVPMERATLQLHDDAPMAAACESLASALRRTSP